MKSDAQMQDGGAIASKDLFGVVRQRWWPTTLECCPPGLFLFDGHFGFKTEYSDQNGPEAYCVESGEYFWGGTNGDAHARRQLMVTPVIINTPNDKVSYHADNAGGAHGKATNDK